MEMELLCLEYFCSFERVFVLQSRDRLALLPDGKLRHYIQHPDAGDAFDSDDDSKNTLWDYAQGKYCMDKVNVSMNRVPHHDGQILVIGYTTV